MVLKITDRERNVQNFRKYIAPQLIENTMKQSRFITEIMVIGDGQKCRQPSFNLILNS
jgi:long-chain acyl-CoA synthetase